jgi:hypothetical protein
METESSPKIEPHSKFKIRLLLRKYLSLSLRGASATKQSHNFEIASPEPTLSNKTRFFPFASLRASAHTLRMTKVKGLAMTRIAKVFKYICLY